MTKAAFVHAVLYNVTTKPHDAAALAALKSAVGQAYKDVPCIYSAAWRMGPSLLPVRAPVRHTPTCAPMCMPAFHPLPVA